MKIISLVLVLLGLGILLGYGVYTLFLFDTVLGIGAGLILSGLLFSIGQNKPKTLYKKD